MFMIYPMNIEHASAAWAHTTQADPSGARAESAAFSQSGGAAARTERDQRILDRLAEMGMDIAEALHGRILTLAAAEPTAPAQAQPAENAVEHASAPRAADQAASELTLAFQRTARAVRQCLALKPKLAEDWRRGAERERALAIEAGRRVRRKAEVRRAVEQAISERPETPHDRAHDKGISERLFADLYDRLESPEIGDELGRHTVGDIATGICRDLGVPPVWNSWQAEPWFEAEGWGEAEEDEEESEEEACTPKPLAQECTPEPQLRPHERPPSAAYLAYLARIREGPP